MAIPGARTYCAERASHKNLIQNRIVTFVFLNVNAMGCVVVNWGRCWLGLKRACFLWDHLP